MIRHKPSLAAKSAAFEIFTIWHLVLHTEKYLQQGIITTLTLVLLTTPVSYTCTLVNHFKELLGNAGGGGGGTYLHVQCILFWNNQVPINSTDSDYVLKRFNIQSSIVTWYIW